jgi:DNA-binding transcriptional LysR family regulator
MLDLRQFQVLRAIAQQGSLAAAARELHYGQPTISHHLGALESHLGARLVIRGPRGAVLTEMGLLLMEHVDPVLDQIDAAETDVKNRVQHGVSTLRVGTFPTAGARLLPRALSMVIPGSGVRVELVEAEPLVLVEKLRAHALHCALIYDMSDAAATDRPDLVITALSTDPYRLLLAADHRLADREVIDLRDLEQEGWILSRDTYDPGDRTLAAACRALGFRPQVALRSDDYSLIQGFVAAGIGVALVPEMAIDRREAVAVRTTVQDVGARCIQLAMPAGRRLPIAEALEGALRTNACR